MRFEKGQSPWNKGIKGLQSHTTETKQKMSTTRTGRVCSEEHKLNLSLSQKGRKLTDTHKRKLCYAKLGKVLSPEHRLHMSIAQKRNGNKPPVRRGADNNKWRGGITNVHKAIRNSSEYAKWREQVFRRDDYTCQACGQHGGDLQADHELPFALYPDLRFEILNGRTLCVPCHKVTPTFGMRALKDDLMPQNKPYL